MTLKILSLYPSTSIATEGFISDAIDFITGNAYGLLNETAARRTVDEVFSGRSIADYAKRANAILSQTTFNKHWVAKSIPKKTTQLKSTFAWIDGMPVSDPVKITALICGPMFEKANEAIKKLEDNTKLRLDLMAQIGKLKEPAQADALYEKHKAALNIDDAGLYLKRGGGMSACVTDSKGTWPVSKYKSKDGKEYAEFCENIGAGVKTQGQIDLITIETASLWGKAISDLLSISAQANEIFHKNEIDYWEGCPFDYDDLSNGDEIFDQIYTGQTGYQASPMMGISLGAMDFAKQLLYSLLTK